MVDRSIGLKIKEQRELHGLTQTELANKIGSSVSLIGMIESGKSNPSVKTIEKVANVFNIDKSYFLKENTVAIDKYIEHLSSEEKDFVLNRKSRPFIKLAKEFFESDLDPDTVKEAVNVLMKFAKKKPETPS